jgi:L-seryl-tRNA(Ser) seleniumtransferase
LPTFRLLALPKTDIEARARRMLRNVQALVGPSFLVEVITCQSQIGSGALPLVTLPSAGLAIRPSATRGTGRLLKRLADALRRLAVPVIGRIEDQALVLDLRCLDDERAFAENLASLDLSEIEP